MAGSVPRGPARLEASDALDETTRDRLLRRVDWRFLLPSPRPTTAAIAADGLLARAVSCVADQVLPLADAPAGASDLVVVRNPGPRILAEAHRALRPGGACYGEWSSPLAGRSAATMLRRAGFRGVQRYWPWPAPNRRRPSFWLPLDAPAALDYFLATRRERRPTTRRDDAVAFVWRLARRLDLLAPVAGVGVKAGGGAAGVLEPHGAVGGTAAWLLLTGGERSLNKVVALAFVDAEPAPQAAVKLARVPEAEPALEREAANLRAIGAAAGAAPELLFLERREGILMLGESVRTGRPLSLLLTRGTLPRLALAVTDWLARLATEQPREWRTDWRDDVAEPAVQQFARAFAPVVSEAGLNATRRALDRLGELPVVPEHRDCAPWNLLLSSDGELVALDWESSEPRGLPVLDLAYFLAYAAFFVDGAMESGAFRDSYAAALDPTTELGRVVEDCFSLYCARLGIDPAAVGPLRLLSWLVHARSEHVRLAQDAAGAPSAAALGDSVFLTLWREELRRQDRRGLEHERSGPGIRSHEP